MEMFALLGFLFLLSLALSSTPPTLASLPPHSHRNSSFSDQQSLLAFKTTLLLDPNNNLSNWTPNLTFCNWTGVTCSSRRHGVRVSSLNITGMDLLGPISPFIANLSFLRLLDLSHNIFHSQIPLQLGRLHRLKILRLSSNKLEGTIPSTLASCRSLQSLFLPANLLTGTIPSELGLLPNLQALELGRNQLTGKIPSSISNISSLRLLELTENSLYGQIPAELGMLTKLYVLSLGQNNFTGVIPTSLSNCTHLQVLYLYSNCLIGSIPLEFGTKMSQLQTLLLWDNQLDGQIPSSLANCSQLQILDLDTNRLTGTVPVDFGKLLQLRRLILFGNQLVSGSSTALPVLIFLTNCSLMEHIDLGENNFTGLLSSSIGLLSSTLSYLRLQMNKFEGEIPDEIGNLTSLTFLDLATNHFNGTIPSTINRLQKLERLYMGGNNFHGRIPSNLGQLKSLGLLALDYSMLSGKIPDSLGQLSQLRQLYLDHNHLSGQIPQSLGRCQTLETLDLSYNKLTGTVPPEVAGLPNLQIYFDLSSNLLQGSLPPEMSKMIMVQAIDVSLNHFSGAIPSSLASCIALQYLNLSWNALEGPIPASLAKLKNLQDIDLSSNNLSGTIPLALEELKMLQRLNFSSNKLTGDVPRHGVFTKLNASAFLQNPGLCGTWIGLQSCSYSNQKKLLLKKVIIPLVIGVPIVIICLLFLIFFRRHKAKSTNSPTLEFGPTRISYKELVDATVGFSEANLLGTGSFGSVYKGVLNNGTNIAVKVFDLQDENMLSNFNRECDALKRVRHRNVIRILTSCSNQDHEFKALVLPFMSNGSLENWLYPAGGEDECKLDLNQRLKIAMEIAQGMAYLHHYCFVQVVHCDLKPSNILLGDDMTVHVADFGISKLIFGNSIDSLASTNVLKGSIGYIAPEYAAGGKVWTKGDVYSYGILLLELLTRRRPTDNIFVEGLNLPKWASMAFPNGLREVVDSTLFRDVNELEISRVWECLTQLMQVGLSCVNESPQERPSMMDIVQRLENVSFIFLGTPRKYEFPMDTSSLLINTTHRDSTMLGSDERSFSSTF